MIQIFEGLIEDEPTSYEKGVYTEAIVDRVDLEEKVLVFTLGEKQGIMSFAELGVTENTCKDAMRMPGRRLGFYIMEEYDNYYVLSRKAVQEQYINEVLKGYKFGDIVEARVTTVDHSRCFVDMGYGISSMIKIENACVAHIDSLTIFLKYGMHIHVFVRAGWDSENHITISLKELLGNWEENYSLVKERNNLVTGYVSKITDYGAFVVLTPNLAGLTDLDSVEKYNLSVGDTVLVNAYKIRPKHGKITAGIKKNFGNTDMGSDCFRLTYFYEGKTFSDVWRYSPVKEYKLV